MRTTSTELPLSDAPSKGPHIIDRLAGFLVSKGMKLRGAKGLCAKWHAMHGDKALEAALRVAEVAPNVGNYPAYIASILVLKGESEPIQEILKAPIVTPVIKAPRHRDTHAIIAERDRMQSIWEQDNADRLAALDPDARWRAVRTFQRAAWLQAQKHLLGDSPVIPDLTPEEWDELSR